MAPQMIDWTWSNVENTQVQSNSDSTSFTPANPGTGDAHRIIQDAAEQASPPRWLVQQWPAQLPNSTTSLLDSIQPITPVNPLPDRGVPRIIEILESADYSLLQTIEVGRILRDYPASCSSDDYHTPLLHRELYSMSTSEITALPKSTTAIMCALGLRDGKNRTFLERAMTAERHRLVEGFPKHSCIEEWDILHAMWLYEMMELPNIVDMDDQWKPGTRTKGLNIPILLKMTRRFCQSHPEATNPSAGMSSVSLDQFATAPSVWMTWLVGETARRTVFLAHIVNYFAAKDSKTGEVSPYYESLDDEMILSMPLPCSTPVWRAKTGQEWLDVLRVEKQLVMTEGQSVLLSKLFDHESTLKSLLKESTKEQLRMQFAGNIGLEDSEAFRRLIIRCALA